jgi:hypothetical protein
MLFLGDVANTCLSVFFVLFTIWSVIFKRDTTIEQPQVVQPTELFKMTKTQPGLYYKLAKEFTPELTTTSAPAPPPAAAIAAPDEAVTTGTDSTSTAMTAV